MSRACARWRRSRDYLTVNISSPNTPGLRDLQDEGELRELLAAVEEARPRRTAGVPQGRARPRRPAITSGSSAPRSTIGIDALIVANTTVSRPPLRSRHAGEAGGLSGEPLKALALDALRAFRARAAAKCR